MHKYIGNILSPFVFITRVAVVVVIVYYSINNNNWRRVVNLLKPMGTFCRDGTHLRRRDATFPVKLLIIK